MDEYITKEGKNLRLGYTTGSCAAAASKAAALMLLAGGRKEEISLTTPSGRELSLQVKAINRGQDFVSCAIEKDGGDDPDITTGTLIFSEVKLDEGKEIKIKGGRGVGRVTKPGLDQPVGEAAINSVPREMIRKNLEEVCRIAGYEGGLSVTISVPEGEELAKKTFNPKLGIVGGISIIGTTGIVEPMSEQALIDTFNIELKQKKAEGMKYALITPGNYGIDFIRDGLKIDPSKAVRISNYIGEGVDACREIGFKGFLLVGHIGKLVKLGGDIWNTHSKYGDHRMEILRDCSLAVGMGRADADKLLDCATTDDALEVLKENGFREKVLHELAIRIEENIRRRVKAKEAASSKPTVKHAAETDTEREIETAPAAETDFGFGVIVFSRVEGFLCKTQGADECVKELV